MENAMRSLPVAVFLVSIITFGHASPSSAQTGQTICQMPAYRGTAMYNKYCVAPTPRPSTNNANPNNDNGAADAAAAAQRQRDAELAQQRIEADNKRRAEEAEKQAKFNQDKQDALGQLKGISDGGDFDSNSGLKGDSTADSGLKDGLNSGQPSVLKTAAPATPPVGTDPMVVDARNVPTGLPKSVAAEIPDTPAGDRVRKGFEAIQDHDWKVALAWFQDALNHDPGNAGIERLIDLAQYTMARANRPHPSVPPAAHTSPQDQAAMASADKQMNDRMDGDLEKALADFRRNYLPKHPELQQPWNSPAAASKVPPAAPAAQPDRSPPGVVPGPTGPNPDWNAFFKFLFARPHRVFTPASVAGVRG